MSETIAQRNQLFPSIKEVKIQEDYIQTEKNSENINTFFQKTFKNTLYACFLSLCATIVSFICNIPLLRMISKETYGVVKIHFELASTLVDFIPRETMRRASQKFCPDNDPEKEYRKFIVISRINYLVMLANAIISIIVFICFMLLTDSQKLHENYIQLLIYILCSFLELSIEPVPLYMNLHMENKYLPIIVSNISKVISNSVFAIFFGMDMWSFTLSRIIGSGVYIFFNLFLGLFKYKLNFYDFIPWNYKSLLFDKSDDNGISLLYLREVLSQFFKLNLLNLIIIRCQNLILSFILKSTDEEKSDYSFIIQNYTVITKFLFQPIIDAFYNLVNKIKYIERKIEINLEEENNDITSTVDDESNIQELESHPPESLKMDEELVENNNEEKDYKNKEDPKKKEINYDITSKLLQLFIKIFSYISIIIIPYYILIGTEMMGLIYGKKWRNNNIDKIGGCYSYYVIFTAILDLIKSFGSATSDKHQMDLSYMSLIINAIFLTSIMYILSKWDICGLILSNVLSAIFLSNYNFYIIFCGKKQNSHIMEITDENETIFSDITNFIRKCFISKNTMLTCFISISLGNILKKTLLNNSSDLIKICIISSIGIVNVILIYFFEKKNFITEKLLNITNK